MSLNRSQLAWLSKLAKTGRAYAGFALRPEELPEWAKLEFRLQRELIQMAKRCERYEAAMAAKKAARMASRETILSVLAKIPNKPAPCKKSYRIGASKGWETRKKQAAALGRCAPMRNGEAA